MGFFELLGSNVFYPNRHLAGDFMENKIWSPLVDRWIGHCFGCFKFFSTNI